MCHHVRDEIAEYERERIRQRENAVDDEPPEEEAEPDLEDPEPAPADD